MTANQNGRYPREISAQELKLILFVLPAESSGYREYRNAVQSMSVLAQGRRGTGHLVLGVSSVRADHDSPLTPVIAFGMMNSGGSSWSVTVRERLGDQIDVELMADHPVSGGVVAAPARSWTYSMWKPGDSSPSTGQSVREVPLTPTDLLVIAPLDRRIWLHNTRSLTNRLIPVTGYHGELMLIERVRDASVALNPASLFESLDQYSDGSLRDAFSAYNRIHPKITMPPEPSPEKRSQWSRLVSQFIRSGSRS